MKQKLLNNLEIMIKEVTDTPFISEQIRTECRGYVKAMYHMGLIDRIELLDLKNKIDKA